MSEYVYAGLTSQTIDIFIQDSSSTTGDGLSGLVFNSASLVASYRKGATGSRVAITLATQTVGGAYSSGGFVEIDATNMKGVYRLDLVNASVDTEGFVTLYLYGATNMLPLALRIDCRPLPVDIKKLLGTAYLTPAVAGTPDVNAKQFGGAPVTATTSVTIPAASTLATTAGAVGSVTAAVTVGTINANVVNASALAADAVAEIQSGLATPTNITAATGITVSSIGADVVNASALAADAVAEIQSGLATPTNITAATGITVSSIEANVVTASALAADAVAEIADGIWDEATSGHTISGTYGGRIVRATNSNVEVQITASNHVAADVHEFQAGVITAGDFAANSITASALAADAVAEIQSGLATAANLLIVSDGVGFITSVLLGTISDAGTAGETYVITFGGATYTLDYTGLDATGNRTGVTRTKV